MEFTHGISLRSVPTVKNQARLDRIEKFKDGFKPPSKWNICKLCGFMCNKKSGMIRHNNLVHGIKN